MLFVCVRCPFVSIAAANILFFTDYCKSVLPFSPSHVQPCQRPCTIAADGLIGFLLPRRSLQNTWTERVATRCTREGDCRSGLRGHGRGLLWLRLRGDSECNSLFLLPNFYVVIVGYQRAFHKPRFVFGTRHYGD